MIKRGLVLVTLATSLVWAAPAAAKLFKWVDENGTTHYGETIPPEYANRSTQTLDKGKVKNRSDEFDPNKRGEMQAAADRKKAEEAAAAEQKRRDNALLNTYSNEKEIDLALTRSLQLLDARVNSFSTMVRSAEETIASHKKEIDERQKSGKKAPQSLLDDLAESEARLVRLNKDLAKSQQDVSNVKARFEADRVRYRELKGIASKP
jgi:chromosome segregation ATPase